MIHKTPEYRLNRRYLGVAFVLWLCFGSTSLMLFGLLCGCSSVMSNEPKETTLSTTESITYEITISIESMSESTTEQTTTIASTAKPTEKQTTATTISGCENGNHNISCGNIGKWFNSRSEVENHWKQIDTKYFSEYESGIMSCEEYSKKSPYGYECWSCSHCGKWTGNFKYR